MFKCQEIQLTVQEKFNDLDKSWYFQLSEFMGKIFKKNPKNLKQKLDCSP